MTTTTYYELNIVEGTDIVNPLIVDNPNYEKIDEAMHDNAVSGVTLATEIANATVHALTRENSECAVIRFIATSEWKAGDTMSVDGVPVTALLPSGETLPDGAYVINANVLCILTGSNLTVFVERSKVTSASSVAYNDTTVEAALDATDVALDNKANKRDYVNSVVGTSSIAVDASAYKIECMVLPYPESMSKSVIPISVDLGALKYATGGDSYILTYGGLDYYIDIIVQVNTYNTSVALRGVKWSGVDVTAQSRLIVTVTK